MRGDVYELRSPRDVRGHEQAGRRYAVVVQNEDILTSTRLVAPTSTSAQIASYRPEVEILGRGTLVLVEQMRAVDPSRLGRFVGRLSLADQQEVDHALKRVLALR
ncbi:MAG: type II toxin-antitoxin system PemK/MazF family toxin [Nocardioides sp.]|uniref:type II toxin-antitoxin system PemK/MazF family toxin n=1 Tax=Nocardioides sp. TaxID=35761 RepID=UPI0039E3BF71